MLIDFFMYRIFESKHFFIKFIILNLYLVNTIQKEELFSFNVLSPLIIWMFTSYKFVTKIMNSNI